jgi:hypothetical protein
LLISDEFVCCVLQLGDGSYDGRSTPPSTDVLTGVAAITASWRIVAYTCALMTTGGVRCWGNNDYGQVRAASMWYQMICVLRLVGI